MKYLGSVNNDKDVVTKEYVDNLMENYSGGGLDISAITGRLNANVTCATGAYTPLTLIQDGKVGEGLTISNGGILVGDGISRILVSGNLHFSAVATAGAKHCRVMRTRGGATESIIWVSQRCTAQADWNIQIPGRILNVEKGDLIKMNYYTSSADTIYSGTASSGWQTWLTARAIG